MCFYYNYWINRIIINNWNINFKLLLLLLLLLFLLLFLLFDQCRGGDCKGVIQDLNSLKLGALIKTYVVTIIVRSTSLELRMIK